MTHSGSTRPPREPLRSRPGASKGSGSRCCSRGAMPDPATHCKALTAWGQRNRRGQRQGAARLRGACGTRRRRDRSNHRRGARQSPRTARASARKAVTGPRRAFALFHRQTVSATIETSFRRRLERFPPDSRRLLLLAAAEPLRCLPLLRGAPGDWALISRPRCRPGPRGLVELGSQVRFGRPLARSARASGPAQQRDPPPRIRVQLGSGASHEQQIAGPRATRHPGGDAHVP